MSAAPDSIGPGYAMVARQYFDAGWAPLPLPAGQKASPPPGTTGADGMWPTIDDIDRWKAQHPAGNIALRMPDTVIGIDVDDYDDKGGGTTLDQLEAELGQLPATWVSTSRGQGGRSGIRLYRIPKGLRLPGVLGPGIDVIQHHHRYMLVPPSTHPNGDRYRIYDKHGQRALQPPAIDELPTLPAAWAAKWAPSQQPAIAPQRATATVIYDDSVAERINRDHDWHTLLYTDGWTMTQRKAGQTHWARPGKDEGTSAVLHEPDGPLVVFSTSVPALQHRWAERDGHWSYSLFGYVAATRHNGDRSGCARAYRQHLNSVETQYHTLRTANVANAVLDGRTVDIDTYAHLVDWGTFWSADNPDEEWLAYPLIPKGRSVALYAPAKAGKSTVVLAAVAALASGGSILGNPPVEPADVLYLDYEMTHADLYERLSELGYGPHTDLRRLHYALLPSLPPLDTPGGAAVVVDLADRLNCQLVVVDTFGRAVEGDEDKADTVRAFYRHTGLALKAKGIAVLRTDHAGKDVDRGQRGSSAKADDVDVVWSLKRTETGVHLKRTHSRVAWVPNELLVDRIDRDGITSYVAAADSYPEGTKETMVLLEQLAVPADASARKAAQALRDAGHRVRNDVLRAAQKARRTVRMPVDNSAKARPAHSEPADAKARPAHWGAPSETLASTEPTAPGALGRTPGSDRGAFCAPIRGATRPTDLGAVDDNDPDDLF
ncbi:MAG: AAA family ATPase [Ilumatobacteraceae bacterium]